MSETYSEVIHLDTYPADQKAPLTDELYDTHIQIFKGVDKEQFAKYVVYSKAQHNWIKVFRNRGDAVVGYTTVHIFEVELQGATVAVFRMEAGLLRNYRGGGSPRSFIMKQVLKYALKHPRRKLFTLSTLVHPSSYLVLAGTAPTIYPHPDYEPPQHIQELIFRLADEFELEAVEGGGPYTRKVGWITEQLPRETAFWKNNPRKLVQFFLEMNPGYTEGDGLLTVIPVTIRETLKAQRRVLGKKINSLASGIRSTARSLTPGVSKVSKAEILASLKKVPLFKELSDMEIEKIAGQVSLLDVKRGDFLFHQNDPGTAMFIILRGSVFVLDERWNQSRMLDQLGIGAVFGEMAFLSGEVRSASVKAVTYLSLIKIKYRALAGILEENPEVKEKIFHTFTQRRFENALLETTWLRETDREDQQKMLEGKEAITIAKDEERDIEQPGLVFVLTGAIEVDVDGFRSYAKAPILLNVPRSFKLLGRRTETIVYFLDPLSTPA